MSGSMPRPGFIRHLHQAVDDAQRLPGQALLPFLPDPVRVDRGDLARRGGGGVREHRQRHVEMVVRMRAPGQAELVAHLRDAHRALHGPEMRVGQRDVDRVEFQRMIELAPVGGDHVGGRRDARGALELGHDLAARVTGFRPARVLGVGHDVALALARLDGFGQRPRAVRVERDARLREALLDRG
jgi:hypothetical protein